MRLRSDRDGRVPRLGWIARLTDSGAVVTCGSHVEVADEWIAEAVWDEEVLPRDDSGAEIAERIGLECQVVGRAEKGVRDELAFWAADGRAWDQNLATFDYERGLTAHLSGAYGGVIWGMDRDERHPATSDFADPTTLSFCEFRLRKGVIHCPVPFLGLDRAVDILRISRSPEIQRRSVRGLYDRPIPRRMLNEAGIPSSMFAQRKSATQFQESVLSFHGLRDWIQEPGWRLFKWANNTMAKRQSTGRRPVAMAEARWDATSALVS